MGRGGAGGRQGVSRITHALLTSIVMARVKGRGGGTEGGDRERARTRGEGQDVFKGDFVTILY